MNQGVTGGNEARELRPCGTYQYRSKSGAMLWAPSKNNVLDKSPWQLTHYYFVFVFFP